VPNALTATGLQTKTAQELISELTTAYQAIYGADINLSSDTPDGQMMRIFVQAVLDLEDLLAQIYNNFDPDLAYGKILDQRVAINGIQRKAGTYTTTSVTVVCSQSVTLQGLDLYPDDPYTIADNSNTQWYLETSTTLSAGTHTVVFRAKDPGATLTIPNTITIPVTVVIGVTSVNNPTSYLTLGLDEETDAELKVRRQKSVSIGSQGYLQGMLAALNNINGATSVSVYENTTGSPDAYGLPSHSINVVVGGAVEPEDVANVIYQKRNAGCGMFGSQSYNITQIDGSVFTVLWDVVTPEPIYLSFNVSSINGTTAPLASLIESELPNLWVPSVNEAVDITKLGTFVQQIDPNSFVTINSGSQGFSLTGSGGWANKLSPTARKNQFVLSSANISITVV
jgi:uncharacterized phage protein gp47/JayE